MNISGKLDVLMEAAAERLRPMREIIRYVRNLTLGVTDRVRLDDFKDPEFMGNLANGTVNGRLLEEGTGMKIVWNIAKLGVTRLDVPLTEREQETYRKTAAELKAKALKAGAFSPLPDAADIFSEVWERNAQAGKHHNILVFDRKGRIAAGNEILKRMPEKASEIADCKRFPRPVRREAAAVVKQQKLAMRN